ELSTQAYCLWTKQQKNQHNFSSNSYFCTLKMIGEMAETQVEEETFTLDEILASIKKSNRLVLWNDDFNTFDHVIHCMVKYLKYSESQAEKIAWTVHTKGKCTILEGSYNEIEIYRKILKEEGLTVTTA